MMVNDLVLLLFFMGHDFKGRRCFYVSLSFAGYPFLYSNRIMFSILFIYESSFQVSVLVIRALCLKTWKRSTSNGKRKQLQDKDMEVAELYS